MFHINREIINRLNKAWQVLYIIRVDNPAGLEYLSRNANRRWVNLTSPSFHLPLKVELLFLRGQLKPSQLFVIDLLDLI